MKRIIFLTAPKMLVFATVVLLSVQTTTAQVNFAFGGNVSVEPQYWSKIGTSDDPKFGIGLGGMVGVGLSIDASMKLLVGPRAAYSMWSADYSNKQYSATQSVYVNMTDMGIGVLADFDDMWIQFGTGSSEISSGMMVSGKDIKYPYDGTQYTYYNVGLGYKTGIFQLGIAYTSYTDYAQYCDHMGFMIGVAL
jgi:hypothetical protein